MSNGFLWTSIKLSTSIPNIFQCYDIGSYIDISLSKIDMPNIPKVTYFYYFGWFRYILPMLRYRSYRSYSIYIWLYMYISLLKFDLPNISPSFFRSATKFVASSHWSMHSTNPMRKSFAQLPWILSLCSHGNEHVQSEQTSTRIQDHWCFALIFLYGKFTKCQFLTLERLRW